LRVIELDRNVTYDSGKLNSYESGTAAGTERQIVSVELTRGNSVKINIPENSIAANETIFASIYYLQPGTTGGYFYDRNKKENP